MKKSSEKNPPLEPNLEIIIYYLVLNFLLNERLYFISNGAFKKNIQTKRSRKIKIYAGKFYYFNILGSKILK